MKHKTIQTLSVLLSLILAFSSLPLSVIAENICSFQNENEEVHYLNLTTEEESENNSVFILQEDPTKRSEFEKHYLCSDGTYVVASYAEAVHYKDDNGEWIDVDNRPMQTTAGDYIARNGDFSIFVPSSTNEGHLLRMDKGEYSLSWTLSANKKAETIKMDRNASAMTATPVQSQKMQVSTTEHPEIITFSTEATVENQGFLSDEATFDLPNISGKIRYHDLFGTNEGVSVVYTTYRNKIEEDIYIEKPTDITSFSMEVNAPDLTPRLNADNSVDFLDNDGNMCYHIGIPYMMDAEFVVLNDIETTVTNLGQTWIITYTPDAQWFTSEERVYPILLDPSITTNDYVSNIQDTYVEENSTTNHSDEQYLQVGAYGYYNRNAIVRIRKLPAIDKSMPIISAKLMLTAQYSPLSDVALKAGYYDSGLDWDDYNYNITTDVFFTYSAYSYLLSGSNTVTFDFTSHIYEMYADEEYDVAHGDDYHGDFIIGYATSGDTTPVYPFFSSEYTTSANRPVFTVKYGYTLPAGMLDGHEDHYVELGYGVTFNDMAIDIGEVKSATIDKHPDNATWASYADFDYSIVSGTEFVFYDANTHRFTGTAEGTAEIRAIHKATGISRLFHIDVDCFAKSLINQGLVKHTDIYKTADGFYMLTTPVSSILNEANIYELSEENTSDGDRRPVLAFYDDWYIYAIRNTTGYSYSLLKMREQENDEIDGDDPGVTISFVALDYDKLLSLINDNSLSNSYSCLQTLNQVTGPGSFPYDETLADYFDKTESAAPYLIAELYIEVIVRETCVNGIISAPQTYLDRLERIDQLTEWISNPNVNDTIRLSLALEKSHLERIPNALENINEKAGYSVYDTFTNTINISNPNNLTIYEKYAILATHTANVTFNSFAAEVEYHAYMLKKNIATDIPIVDHDIYDSALRADMAMGEEVERWGLNDYYDLNSDRVQAQAEYHGEY